MSDNIDKLIKKIMDETAELLKAETLDVVQTLQKKIEADIKLAEEQLKKQISENKKEC
jgi:hypothetical protein